MAKFRIFQSYLSEYCRSSVCLSSRGQSTVEYILVLAVVISLSLLVFRSNQFRNFLGENGRMTDIVTRQLEYSYRHGRPGDRRFQPPNYATERHESYVGRFFIGSDPYPE